MNAGTGFRIANAATSGNVLRGDGTNFISATLGGGDITGAALTKSDDTNVTLTLGGTPATSLLRAASLTLGWTGQLGVARGGTGAATFTKGVLVSPGTTTALTTLAGTDNYVPKWTTSGYLSLTSLIYDDGTNVGIGTTTPAGLFDVNGKLTVLSSGNVGIGTTTPTVAALQVTGGGYFTTGLSAGDTNVTSGVMNAGTGFPHRQRRHLRQCAAGGRHQLH